MSKNCQRSSSSDCSVPFFQGSKLKSNVQALAPDPAQYLVRALLVIDSLQDRSQKRPLEPLVVQSWVSQRRCQGDKGYLINPNRFGICVSIEICQLRPLNKRFLPASSREVRKCRIVYAIGTFFRLIHWHMA